MTPNERVAAVKSIRQKIFSENGIQSQLRARKKINGGRRRLMLNTKLKEMEEILKEKRKTKVEGIKKHFLNKRTMKKEKSSWFSWFQSNRNKAVDQKGRGPRKPVHKFDDGLALLIENQLKELAEKSKNASTNGGDGGNRYGKWAKMLSGAPELLQKIIEEGKDSLEAFGYQPNQRFMDRFDHGFTCDESVVCPDTLKEESFSEIEPNHRKKM
eukprot:CAMPEP_0202468330 /NCGR_PEP_ID=MMETSP1360-20130828/74959_1 /ASSEMBLY_ACC=CAM_ASM_000848 /TAXON_ID=515479 /ORGANISM="Licmophora paradoxa, Strain CCMP2313" /LENGTH=212 /DNA_ID=CAMNT_0049093229 /DNA_START=35 /DNA_END=673 /DNA_ORIENTATION=+